MAKAPSDILEADLWGALLPEIGSWLNFAKKGLDVDETWFNLVNKTIHNKALCFQTCLVITPLLEVSFALHIDDYVCMDLLFLLQISLGIT